MLGCPIRKSPDQWLFAPTRSLSQLITSFIASQSLGIHRSLLFAFFILLFARTWVRYVAISYFKYSIPFLLITNYSLLIRVRYCFTTFSLFLSIYQRSSLFTIYSFTIYYFISQWQGKHEQILNNVLIVSGSLLIIFSVFFLFSKKNNPLVDFLWRISGSNRWPPACKAGALSQLS